MPGFISDCANLLSRGIQLGTNGIGGQSLAHQEVNRLVIHTESLLRREKSSMPQDSIDAAKDMIKELRGALQTDQNKNSPHMP